MKKIIVPIDFTEESLSVFKKAVYIAQKTVAEISLIHVKKENSFSSLFSGASKDIYDKEIEQKFEEIIKKIPHWGVPVDYHFRKGREFHEIVQFAEKEKAYMIIMNAYEGKPDPRHIASTAYKVVAAAESPVLTLREHTSRLELRKIVLPIDDTQTTRQKVPFTIEMAKFFRSRVYVVGVCPDETEELVKRVTSYSAQACRILTKHGINNEYEYIAGTHPVTQLFDYTKKVEADLLVIMTDQDDNLISNIMGHHAAQIINESPIPVLSIHRDPNLEGDVSIM